MGRLLASTTCMPAASAVLSVSVVSAAVTSTRIGFERAWRAANVTASVAHPRGPPPPLAFASRARLRGAWGEPSAVALRRGRRREAAGGDAGGPRHAEPDDHERRRAGAHFHAADFLPSDLAPERLVEPPARPLRLVLRDAEADR